MKDIVTTGPVPTAVVQRMKEYHPPLGDRSGLRLDFNENTVSCSPRVLEVLGNISGAQLTVYPERGSAEAIIARHLGLTPGQVLLTNGVDEAIHVLCQTYLDHDTEMLLPVPTYSMYAVYASGTPASLVEVLAEDDFDFPVEAILRKIRPSTRLIAIANPNSPTGKAVKREDILRIIDAAPQAMVLVDEAYFHFHGETVLDLIGRVPNVIVARTFSKAYGLANLRLGMLAAGEEAMRWLRRVISPYSVNGLALACLPAALEDTGYLSNYVNEVLASREQLGAALTGMGVSYWPSQANFLLTRIGPKHAAFAAAVRARGVLTRDRSSDPGCEGCVRITLGTQAQTASAIEAMKAALNEIGWNGETA